MYQWIADRMGDAGLGDYAAAVAMAATLLVVVAACIVARLITRLIAVKVSSVLIRRTKYIWDDILFDSKVFHRLANAAVPAVLSAFADATPVLRELLGKAAGISGAVVTVLLVDALLNAVGEIYGLKEVSKIRPIKSLLQACKVAAVIVGGITVIAILAGESPLVLLGGIGAMTAVTSLIFKDAILGFVAGIQLTGNDMIRIGDWIEVPGRSANGTVTELSMTTVKVRNFDRTITSVPAYTLVSDAFINWRGMEVSGGRRIKRAIRLDAAGVRFCDGDMLRRLQEMPLLRAHFGEPSGEAADEGGITNLGAFRAYIAAYLREHPGIQRDAMVMVRQLEPEDRGLPLELYAFAATTDWERYEGIQSDIFEHLYAVAPAFGLSVYQRPSGGDVRGTRA